MRAAWMLAVLLVAAMAGAAGAAPKADYSAINQLFVDVESGRVQMLRATMRNARDEMEQEGWKAKDALESHLDAAIAAAKENRDLLNATKEFYLAAIVYFERAAAANLFDTRYSAAEDAVLKEKEKSLQIELKLVQ